MNASPVSEDCWFAVQLSRRIFGKSRSYLNAVLKIGTSKSVCWGLIHGELEKMADSFIPSTVIKLSQPSSS